MTTDKTAMEENAVIPFDELEVEMAAMKEQKNVPLPETEGGDPVKRQEKIQEDQEKGQKKIQEDPVKRQKKIQEDPVKVQQKVWAELPSDKESGILSRILLWWAVPLLARGRDKCIDANTIPRLDTRFQAEDSLQRFSTLWEIEKKKKKPSVLRVLCKMPLGSNLYVASVFGMLQGVIMTALRPIVLKQLITIISSPESDVTGLTIWLAVFILTLITETLILTWYLPSLPRTHFCHLSSEKCSSTSSISNQKGATFVL
jgi:hypothetical protein